MSILSSKTARFFEKFKKDDAGGTSTIEFIVVFPMFFAIFFWVFETGFYTFQSIMLDRGVHNTVRELMLTDVTANFQNNDGTTNDQEAHAYLVSQVCNNSFLVNCEENLKLELQTIDASTETVTSAFQCVDRSSEVDPVYGLDQGSCDQGNADGSNPNGAVTPILVIFRACLLSDPILPSGMSLPWDLDSNGAIRLRAESAFLNEPC